ncbi:MAG: hypothetical protein RLZZ546_1779 [Bacteroidota bacterium]|jgi:NADP-dependent 3-hydroxy acid dehydrogenase YdfG
MTNLKDKVAVVFAASGVVAGAVAKSLAEHGAKVYLSSRDLASVEALAAKIKLHGGWAEAHQVDAMNEGEIDSHLSSIVADNGSLDIVFNGIGAIKAE